MKKLSLKNAENFLSRNEMKAIKGGKLPGGGIGSTTCYDSSQVCYTDGNTTYTCSAPPDPQSEEDCCCGHSAGQATASCVMG